MFDALSESIPDRLLAKDYSEGAQESDFALRVKPADPRPNFLRAVSDLGREQYDTALFFLARTLVLSSEENDHTKHLKKQLTGLYKSYHGSGKGLDELLRVAQSNVSPPSGFKIEQHSADHAAAKTIAALVIAGLVTYAAVKSPDTFAAIGQSVSTPAQASSGKVMIFGGEDHKTYIGCLSCPKGAADSVLTPGGDHGPPNEGIWDKAGFGSPASQYSACSVFASDPPVIVNEDGTYLGRLTLNRNHGQVGIGVRFYDWLHDSVCN